MPVPPPSAVLAHSLLFRSLLVRLLLVGYAIVAFEDVNAHASDPPPVTDRAQFDFFEQHIRPALLNHCQECHSVDDANGNLRLDSRNGWMIGGDLGQAIIPGDANASLLMQALRYDDADLAMPPDGKLDEATIAAFEKWINDGARDPRTDDSPSEISAAPDLEAIAAQLWSYQPLASSPIGEPHGSRPIDGWIKQKLDERGLIPAPSVSNQELLRRLSFDLRGLPPTRDELNELAQFESETDAERFLDQITDRFLSDPAFGEHFARHWMDVARYAESITLRGFVLDEAWRYRDYLIAAFNDDRPFNQMVIDQLAGDLVEHTDLEQRRRAVVATTFLTLGNSNLEQQDKSQLEFDYIDEQLETIGRAFLGQTLGCARCHDHKFDPISTRDYYAMAAILKSTVALEHANLSKWIEKPLPMSPSEEETFSLTETRIDQINKAIAKLKKELGKQQSIVRSIPRDRLPGIVVDDASAKFIGDWQSSTFSPGYVDAGYRHDAGEGRGEKTVTFEPRGIKTGDYKVRMSYTANTNRASNVQVRVFSAIEATSVTVNQRVAPNEDGIWVTLGTFPFEENGQSFVIVSNENANGHVIADAVQFIPVDGEPLRVTNNTSENDVDPTELDSKKRELANLELTLKDLQKTVSARPRYITVVEGEPMHEMEIRIRGNVHSRGAKVKRGFVKTIPPCDDWSEKIDGKSSGRLEFAHWITDPRNPLTARVYVNRVWSWLMGTGLVLSQNNFGTTGDPPSHPELLDHLASDFMKHGWSTKRLVKQIVASDVYRRSIVPNGPATQDIDPNNRLYWSGNLKRLPIESIRDTMLSVSGELDRRMGGSDLRSGLQSDYDYEHDTLRRSLYAPVLRNSLPPLFSVFDFPDTSVSGGARSRSTIATQSLAMMNHPWIVERTKASAKRWNQRLDETNTETVVQELFLDCLAREPIPSEVDACINFLEPSSAPDSQEERLCLLIQSLFASIDFRYLD